VRVASFEAIVRALNDAKVPFIVVGGLAVNAHGYGRDTDDVDLVVRLQPDVIRSAFGALASIGYHPRVPITAEGFANAEQRTRWQTEKGMRVLNFYSDLHRETPLDLFVTEPFDFAREYKDCLVEEVAPGVPVRIVTLATLLRLKREAGRAQDVADIAELRLTQEGGQ
jgi:predicted nucleotidyltransferase